MNDFIDLDLIQSKDFDDVVIEKEKQMRGIEAGGGGFF